MPYPQAEHTRSSRVTRAYFDATPDSPDEEVAAELPRHSVFRLIPGPQLTGHYWTLAHTSRRKVASC